MNQHAEVEITDRLYGPWESKIRGWEDFYKTVGKLSAEYSERTFVWRGTRRAEWGVKSSLYRTLEQANGAVPDEQQMVDAEKRILNLARTEWRFDHLPALEIFAHLQHYGGPTRMLDVSYNPMIAMWFAVESRPADDAQDGRLFAFTSGAREVELNTRWYGREPRWHALRTNQERRAARWGTGEQRRIWRPPAFNERIASQNAAFLIDGAPLYDRTKLTPKVAPEDGARWDVDELRQVSSLNFRPSRVQSRLLPANSAPGFTMRIAAAAKREIRDQLEQRFGFRASSIYSDMSGLAAYLADRPEKLS